MNLQQLEYFKIVAEVENFTTASKLLSVTQPALSKSIANLEEELGVSLFEKQGRNIRLTKYGAAFLSHATIALKELEYGIEALKDLVARDQDTLTIATTSELGFTSLPRHLQSFLGEHPDSKLTITYEEEEDVYEKLRRREVEFGFLFCLTPLQHRESFCYHPVSTTEYFVRLEEVSPSPIGECLLQTLK